LGNFKFCPDISGIAPIELRPYMVESAYDYYMICITSPHQRMSIQTVMCALAIEILLKSFHAKVTGNHGKLNETYGFNKKESLPKEANAHDLIALYEALPKEIKEYLFKPVDLDILADNKDLFTQSRYVYESTANRSHNDSIIKLAACLICKIIFLYKQRECADPFITSFYIEEFYLNQVQQILAYSAP